MLPVTVVDGTIPPDTYSMLDGVGVAMNRLYVPHGPGVRPNTTNTPNLGHTLADEVVSIFHHRL